MIKTLSIVIPCFNEEEAIPLVIPALLDLKSNLINKHSFSSIEILVIDDASVDKSADRLMAFGDTIQVIRNSTNQGYGGALKEGFAKARGEWISFLDMDNSYPVASLPHLFETAIDTNSDLIVGARSIKASGMSPLRGLGNWMFSKLTSILFNISVSDACSGFRIFNRRLLPLVLNIDNNSLGYSLEMSIRVTNSPFKTSELAIDYHPRSGSSKLSVWKDGWSFLFIILQRAIAFHLRQKPAPTVE